MHYTLYNDSICCCCCLIAMLYSGITSLHQLGIMQ